MGMLKVLQGHVWHIIRKHLKGTTGTTRNHLGTQLRLEVARVQSFRGTHNGLTFKYINGHVKSITGPCVAHHSKAFKRNYWHNEESSWYTAPFRSCTGSKFPGYPQWVDIQIY